MHVDGSNRTSIHSHCSHDHPQEQKEKGVIVLGLFPGVLRMTPNCKEKPMPHERHGVFGCGGMSEFEWFVKNLLSRVQPKQTWFRLLQRHHPISKLLTASDKKTFALMTLDNELHVWG